jgi:hypothetical protein
MKMPLLLMNHLSTTLQSIKDRHLAMRGKEVNQLMRAWSGDLTSNFLITSTNWNIA